MHAEEGDSCTQGVGGGGGGGDGDAVRRREWAAASGWEGTTRQNGEAQGHSLIVGRVTDVSCSFLRDVTSLGHNAAR